MATVVYVLRVIYRGLRVAFERRFLRIAFSILGIVSKKLRQKTSMVFLDTNLVDV